MTKTAQRISYFDNLKGILIILVVFAHCLYDYQGFHYVNLVTDTIYVFHMPAFVFVTGFLSKSEHSRSKESLGRLLAAYLIFNTFMLLYELVKNGASMSLLTPYYSCWYLLAVIAWRAVSGWASRQKGVMVWSLLLALSAGFFVDVSNLLSVGRIIAFYPFFLAGFLLPAEKLPVKNKSGALCFKGAALTAVSVALAALFVYRHKISDSILLMNGYADASGLLCRVIIFAVSALTEIYFDRDSKEITGAAVIPMWTQSQLSGNYRALPIYDILHDTQLRAELSTYDLERVEQVQQHITEIMLGCNVPCSAAERRYFITDSGYMAQPAEPVALTEEEKASPLYQKLSEAESVCFVGDSITHGTKNGGFGWYRPLESLLNNVTECAAGGATTKSILPEVPTGSGMYVVALGTNDIRYRDEDICAMTAEDYIAELERFVQRVRSENSGAEFAFVAPWTSLDNDSVSKLSTAERNRMNGEYTEKLRAWCGENGHLFSDPNDIIDEVMCREVQSDYLVDYIHPNRNAGIELYTRAVLAGSQPVL